MARLTTNQHWVTAAEFSPDDRTLIIGTGTDAMLYDAASGRRLGVSFSNEGQVSAARFSPDGRWLVTATDGVARVWEVASGRPVSAPMRHGGKLFTANFSPDGKRVVTACADHTARVWEARTGLPLGGPMLHPGEVTGAGFSPDGRWVLTACRDGTARLWELPVVHGPVPSWLADFAEAVAGFRFDATGSVELVFAPALDRVRQQIRAAPTDETCARWAVWLLDDDDRKSVSPSAVQFDAEHRR